MRTAPVMLALMLLLVGALAAGLAPATGGAGSVAAEANWPMYRGNLAHTGTLPGPGNQPDFGPSANPDLVWSFQTGAWVDSSPAIVNGVVYAGSSNGTVYALDALTGLERWRFETEPWLADHSSSPAVSEGYVYVGSQDGHLYALDAATGAERWRFKTGGAVRSSPAIADGSVYFGSGDGTFYAVDAVQGTERWRFLVDTDHVGLEVNSSPAVADGTVYFGAANRVGPDLNEENRANVFALDAKTGAERWRVKTTPENYVFPNRTDTSLAVVNGVVYVSNVLLHALDAATGVMIWRFRVIPVDILDDYVVFLSSPAVVDGTVYVGNQGATPGGEGGTRPGLYALDAATGAVKWHVNTGGLVASSPAVADGVVYFGSEGSGIYAIDAATGTELWNLLRTETRNVMGSSPAVADGVLYTGTGFNGAIAAIATGAPRDDDPTPDSNESQ